MDGKKEQWFLIKSRDEAAREESEYDIVTAEPDANGETRFTFAQEWPLAGVRHQLGFGIPVFCPCGEPGRDVGLGDVELSYR